MNLQRKILIPPSKNLVVKVFFFLIFEVCHIFEDSTYIPVVVAAFLLLPVNTK